MRRKIAIDIGSSTILMHGQGGRCVDQPGILVVGEKTREITKSWGTNTVRQKREILCFGEEAKRMLGKCPAGYKDIMPIKAAHVDDIDLAADLIGRLIDQVYPKSRLDFLNPCAPTSLEVVVGVSCECNIETRRTIKDAVAQAIQETRRFSLHGEVGTMEQGIASLYGSGLDVDGDNAVLCIEVGAGTTDVVLAIKGKIAVKNSIPIAGLMIDEALQKYAKERLDIEIGPATAERAKVAISTGHPFCLIRGKDVRNKQNKGHYLTRDQYLEAVEEAYAKIVESVRSVLEDEDCTPEMLADLSREGSVILTGGGTDLYQLAERISTENNLPTLKKAQFSRFTVIMGLAKAQKREFDEVLLKELVVAGQASRVNFDEMVRGENDQFPANDPPTNNPDTGDEEDDAGDEAGSRRDPLAA